MTEDKPGSSSRDAVASSSSKKHVLIIGAGAGGTCLAARLGKLGHRVTVLEKNTFGGGRCSLLTKGGHRWDQGPSLYLMPEIFKDAFEYLDERVEDHLTLHRCDPAYHMHFATGFGGRQTNHAPRPRTTSRYFHAFLARLARIVGGQALVAWDRSDLLEGGWPRTIDGTVWRDRRIPNRSM